MRTVLGRMWRDFNGLAKPPDLAELEIKDTFQKLAGTVKRDPDLPFPADVEGRDGTACRDGTEMAGRWNFYATRAAAIRAGWRTGTPPRTRVHPI